MYNACSSRAGSTRTGFPTDLDSLFRSFFAPFAQGLSPRSHGLFSRSLSSGTTTPAINLWEEDGNYVLEAELPGYALDAIDLQVHGDQVLLSGKRDEQAPEGVTFRRRERGSESFERKITLPSEIELDGVEATLKHGLLRVTLPPVPWAQPRKITVNG